MSVTVVGNIQAGPGQGNPLVSALAPPLQQTGPSAQAQHVARLLQSTDDPDRLRYVAPWDSWEAYQAHVQVVLAEPHEALRRGQIALYEDMSWHAAMVACVTLTAAPQMAAMVRALFAARAARS